jgi:fructokinase
MNNKLKEEPLKRITAFGEILFDVYPGTRTLGGAPFNFIYHINKLAGLGNFISSVGDDNFGKEILNFLKSNNISSDYVAIDKNHSTGVANANLDKNKIPHWEIEPDCAYDFIRTSDKILNLIEEKTDCLYFGTLIQRSDISRGTINRLFGKKIKYFCDLNFRQNFFNIDIINSSLNTAHILKLNNDELKIVNDLLLKQNYDEEQLAELLSKRFNIEIVCVTLGDKGAILYKNGTVDRYKADVENVVDTVGAGDAYASVLCIGNLYKWNISKINRIASEFAAAIVQIKGALPKEEGIYELFKEKIRSG